MSTHRWTSSTRLNRHDTGKTIEQGDTFEPTESELRAFGDHMVAVEDDEPEDADDTTDEDVAFDEDAWFDDHDGYEDRIATVKSGDVDAILDEIEEVETSDNAVDAIQARRDELSDE
jgi:hypothetical protein